jgi:transcriptional regulator GlxA family with amidase domain
VQVLRSWVESLPEGRGGWMGALRDARFAARFTTLVGEPPLAYVSRWRLETAAGLRQDGALGLGEIASRVGYESEAAFSKAFRRRSGAPPGAYRRRVAAA